MANKLACLITVLCFVFAQPLYAHCEIPCGIYNDDARLAAIEEHVTTIEKSMKSITELSAEKSINYNQLVRWVDNKEHHADQIQEIVSQYFMTQRVKPVDEKDVAAYDTYVKQITLLHQMLIYAMKAKQTTDPAVVETLRSLVVDFRAAYK